MSRYSPFKKRYTLYLARVHRHLMLDLIKRFTLLNFKERQAKAGPTAFSPHLRFNLITLKKKSVRKGFLVKNYLVVFKLKRIFSFSEKNETLFSRGSAGEAISEGAAETPLKPGGSGAEAWRQLGGSGSETVQNEDQDLAEPSASWLLAQS